VVPPSLTRDAYRLDQFLAELAGPSGAVRVVRVHKRRVRYRLGGCMAEIAEVQADGRTQRTVAVESDDPSAVIAAVRGVGLDGHANTSYPRGLAALIDGPSRHAVIDVGTNSVKFHVGERDASGSWRAIVDRAEVTRLGENLQHTGAISAEPLERTVAAIAGMVEEARRHQVRTTAAVGTAGLRIARNREDILAAIRARGSRSASAWRSGRCASPSASGWPAWWTVGCCEMPWRRSRPTWLASMAARGQMPWWGWAAR
jgi:exopolyphosphatase/guanosine-5'-triphosphate,3'-diphosphate pyrophosphatase